jgi:hypothetical protein
MKHFKTEDWVDFANEVISEKKREAMRKHLDGCKECTEKANLWERVRKAAAAEANYQPPLSEVRIAKAAFAGAGLTAQQREQGSGVTVLFDSFLQPLMAGARSVGLGTRQMLYRADPFQIDVQIEPKPDGDRLMVTGQLLDVSSPGIVGRDVQITLSTHHGSVIQTTTNQFGEFRGEIENTGDLELSFPGQGQRAIVISLRNPLGNSTGSRAC